MSTVFVFLDRNGRASSMASKIILHISPGRWNLPSVDPSCLAAVLYLQYTIPGSFAIVECGNPDVAPTGMCLLNLQLDFLNSYSFNSGQLPFLTHEGRTIPTFALIVKYVAGLKDVGAANLDASLNNPEQSRKVAWCAHVESNLGDLVVNPCSRYVSRRSSLILKYHTLYSHHGNWAGLTQPALASMLPVPQSYYVPGRIRESYRARLEAADLWTLPEIERKEKKPFRDLYKSTKEKVDSNIYLQAFEREKVCKLTFSAMLPYHLVSGLGESSGFHGYLHAPSWP